MNRCFVLVTSVRNNLNHAWTNDAALDHVALLELLGNRVIFFIGVFDPHDRLMEVRVELLADGLDVLKAILLEDFLELREDHLNALLESRGVFRLGCHCAFEIIEQRQHVLAEVLRDHRRDFFAFLRRTAAEVLKISLQPQKAVFLLLQIGCQFFNLAFQGFNLLLCSRIFLTCCLICRFFFRAFGSVLSSCFRFVDFLLHFLHLLLIFFLHFIFDKGWQNNHLFT